MTTHDLSKAILTAARKQAESIRRARLRHNQDRERATALAFLNGVSSACSLLHTLGGQVTPEQLREACFDAGSAMGLRRPTAPPSIAKQEAEPQPEA